MIMAFFHLLPHLMLDISQLSDLDTELSKARRGVAVLPLSDKAQEQAEELLQACLKMNGVFVLNELFIYHYSLFLFCID